MFKKIFKKMNPLSGLGGHEFVGVDVSGNSLKLAYARRSGVKLEIVTLLSQATSGLSDSDIVRLLAGSYSKLKVKNPTVVSVIPAHMVITKNIEIPSTNPQEIKEIISLQAGRHTPYARDEIIIDHINISTYKHDYTKVLLIIVTRSAIKKQFDILTKAGIRLEKVFFSPEGFALTVPRILKINPNSDFPLCVVHIDEFFSDFAIVFKNKVIFIRSIPIGCHHLFSEKERFFARFIEEIKRSQEAYQSESIEKIPNMLFLTGAMGESKEIEAALADSLPFSVKSSAYLEYFSSSEEFLKADFSPKEASFFNILAPLLVYEDMKVDLVPEEIKLRRVIEERGKELIKTGILVLTIFVLIFSILVSKIYFKTTYLNNITKKYGHLADQARVLEDDFERINMIKDYLAERGYSIELLAELYNIIPLEMELNDIRYDQQGKFSIRGSAESMSIVFSFVDNLKKSKYFQDVKTKYTTKRKVGTIELTDFEIACILNKGEQ
ncbi:MAG: pilus assembly protein PilM [Candidatus Omnitrophica bacterium]|nr:pilus assembly protein PilM [Candidatus Omnitrophota bacterium]